LFVCCAGVMLNQKLQWTEMIYSHGLDLLSSTPTPYLRDQVRNKSRAGGGTRTSRTRASVSYACPSDTVCIVAS
jgi:hypothetical protein